MKPAPASDLGRTAAEGISRMPCAVRDQVSRAIEDGVDWRAVARICAAAGFPGIRLQNVTNYRKGAHQEWLARESRIEAMRRDSEQTRDAIRFYAEHGGNPAEAGLLAAAEMMQRVIRDMGVESFKAMAADNPETVFKMLRELRGFSETLAKHTAPAAAAAEEARPAVTPEQRAAALKEIFGLPV